MKEIRLTELLAAQYAYHLREEEKSRITIEKYLRDVRGFARYLGSQYITKDAVIAYKQQLLNQGYALRSVNSMLAAVNSFLTFCGLTDCRVRLCRMQREIYQRAERELSRAEYLRLLRAAEGDRRLWLLMQTICSTGIRVSELNYFTVEAVRRGEVSVACKNKSRKILLPGKLRRLLLDYAGKQKIRSGVIFLTGRGKPLNRKAIWAQMKGPCKAAGVKPVKVFPHNLRKLFARTFHGIEKDIAKLADILGHSSVDTTRIYIMTSGTEHRQQLERLGLVV